ncbi:unnamed protein product [Euphydryas editha]|uniref:Uncharacterized protein n=1 Tax=Euphydryas editha TaxID=104508 RepID=A0AAU9TU39_EUPED|nr:unnamed protein product [Euphydryas editha]
MLFTTLCGIFSILPFSFALINCRLACKRCRENIAYPEMLEVYCAMCNECRGRRRGWLQGKRNLRTENENQLNNDELDGYLGNYLSINTRKDDCVPQTEDLCEDQQLLSEKITTSSTTTTTTTTTSTTTHRPCYPKPNCVKPTRAPCYSMPCPVVPLAMPVCPMCPMVGTGSIASSTSTVPTLPHDRKVVDSVTANTDSLFFYVGVPKKLLKDLKLLNNP